MDKKLRKETKGNILRNKLRIICGIEKGFISDEEKKIFFKEVNEILKEYAKKEIKKQSSIIQFKNCIKTLDK